MNTKQVLYNALASQLETKKSQAEEYSNEVYNPAVADLKSDVLDYFERNIGGFKAFNFTGTNIRLDLSDNSYYDRVEVTIPNTWREEHKEVQIEWNSGNYSNSNNNKKNYLELLNKVYTNFDEISNKFLNEWYVKHLDIENKNNNAWKEYNELKIALSNLQTEIRNDAHDAMMQIGYEIKSFKQDTSLDWEYGEGSERIYKTLTRNKSFTLQYGRSQYDTIYVSGYKVLGKKGNKYKVEVYRDGYENRTYDVLEKKFEAFIHNVSNWENKEADERRKNTLERYNSYTK